MIKQSFEYMNLKPQLQEAIVEKGFDSPTPIQDKSIPPALQGRDIMGQAQTGTGKTASFGIPILNGITKGNGLQALVVCPTRELAVQVAEEISSLGKNLQIYTLAVYGGQSIDIQLRALKKQPEIIVGTPGRLLDHFQRRTINFRQLKYVVLDEADEMLDMGFMPDIEKILSQCPTDRQTFLFSATLMEEIRALGAKFMKDPEIILIEPKEITVPLIKQSYYDINPAKKIESLCRILDVESPALCLIFCRTKKGVDHLARALEIRGYGVDGLHGDMSQRERDSVMEKFRQGNIEILVATDLAARGLDVELVTHVINYDIPEDPESYVHRIGRTGRAGRDGDAITLVEPRQFKQIRFIERLIGKKIARKILPTLEDAIERKQDRLTKQVDQAIQSTTEMQKDLAQRLLNIYDATDLVAACIRLMENETPEIEETDLRYSDRDMVNVELSMGKLQGVHPRILVNYLTSNTKLSPKQVGDIEISSNTTFIEIPMEFVDEVYEVLKRYERSQRNKGRGKAGRYRRK